MISVQAIDPDTGIAARRMPIYLDHHATTPLDPRVQDAMLPFFNALFGNAGSAEHRYGWRAQEAVEDARARVAALVGARSAEIVFTSGATEANNIALMGSGDHAKRHLITTGIEHASVAACAAERERRGGPITILPVDRDGRIDPAQVATAIRPDTGLISIALANHEIGAIQPLDDIGNLARRHGILFHVDATQAAGHIPVSLPALQADFLSLSAHKLHGPTGVGALVVTRQARRHLRPILFGGDQERGFRPGTLPVPLIVGFGAAAEIAREAMPEESLHLAALRGRLLDRLAVLPGLRVHGGMRFRLPGNLNVGWPGLVARDLIDLLRDHVALSSGSACGSATLHPSPVLRAIGLTAEEALGGLRFGLGRFTTEAEVERAATAILRAAPLLRR
ncbi:cysteine desulfurase family protein [Neoroseomonas lacus]|uniref:Cysteine desulfurase n=1 Tax=Neoroseomonas lacus TaxID=287609 RepID=A0A917K9X7_9PROT|nr:cysteine desulfurase family protein [Neoroseomonas lacus]GGJ04723.1 cysteine desulfurase IscS [Neoroseomonas lacus]